jgi:ribosomal protein L7/L12
MNTSASIPADAQRAADRGELIEAIKITREATGLGLKEAKDAVDAYVQGRKPVLPRGSIPTGAIVFLQEGRLVDAVRLTRQAGGLQLKEAYDAVNAYLDANPAAREQYRAARQRLGRWRRLLLRVVLLLLAAAIVLKISGWPEGS